MFAIEANDGKYIGGCGANNLDMKNRVAEVGIFIGDKDYLGKGYGTEAMELLLQFLFDEVNMNKVSLNVIAFNKRAVRSYEKASFKLEATAREAIYRLGRYNDLLTMSILKEEYELKRGTRNE
jgi:RimJ/RimL family protein N-acetyltransferase